MKNSSDFCLKSGPVHYNYDVQSLQIEDERVKGQVTEGKIIYIDWRFSMLHFKEPYCCFGSDAV